jgi:hypothetical protein
MAVYIVAIHRFVPTLGQPGPRRHSGSHPRKGLWMTAIWATPPMGKSDRP